MALNFTPNKMRNCRRIWSGDVWSLTMRRDPSGICVEKCGQHGLKLVGGRASPIPDCCNKTGERQADGPIMINAGGGEKCSNYICCKTLW